MMYLKSRQEPRGEVGIASVIETADSLSRFGVIVTDIDQATMDLQTHNPYITRDMVEQELSKYESFLR